MRYCVAGGEWGWWGGRHVVAADQVAEEGGGLGAGLLRGVIEVTERFITIMVGRLSVL